MTGMDFSELFTTKLQASDFCDRISEVSDLIFQEGFDLEQALAPKLGVTKRDKLMILIRDNADVSNNSQLQGFFVKMVNEIKQMPFITLTLAFVPNEKHLKEISSWMNQNLNKQVLIDFDVDERMIGGIKINYNGRYQDLSVWPVFEEVMKKVFA